VDTDQPVEVVRVQLDGYGVGHHEADRRQHHRDHHQQRGEPLQFTEPVRPTKSSHVVTPILKFDIPIINIEGADVKPGTVSR
jgi:hypothetical protein